MTGMGRREYLRAIHRKYAIRLLGQPRPEARPGPRRSRDPS
jgi:hypothetical protein